MAASAGAGILLAHAFPRTTGNFAAARRRFRRFAAAGSLGIVATGDPAAAEMYQRYASSKSPDVREDLRDLAARRAQELSGK